MALVEVARFADLTEAHVAAAGLRSAGMPVLVQNADWGQNAFPMQIAMGGFRVWTAEEDAGDARDFIRACRRSDPAAVDWPSHPYALRALPLALAALFLLFVTGNLAWILAAVRRRPSIVGVGLLALLLGYALWACVLVWRMARSA
ncbi:MAG TPA: DUF2007 domain-containing protein [Caulobacteraceae bacterium]|nr:DUF2007 domain-containing protein [Caulobacteraceae bacterium]